MSWALSLSHRCASYLPLTKALIRSVAALDQLSTNLPNMERCTKLHKEAPHSSSSLRGTSLQTGSAFEPSKSPPALWHLPLELRDMIYHEVFRSTRLSHGKTEMIGQYDPVWIQPAPYSLALLKTCHQIRREIGKRWMGQVLFNFEDVETMMDKLTGIPPEDLSLIRHLRVRGAFCDRELLPDEYATVLASGFQYTLAHYLYLLPGLHLDTLTVLDNFSVYEHGMSHDAVTSLIQYGQGWKELRLVSTDTNLLGPSGVHDPRTAYTDPNGLVKVRPDIWADAIGTRDGAASQPTVKLYRYRQASRTPVPIYQPVPLPGSDAVYQDSHEPQPERTDLETIVLIVVNRGRKGPLWESRDVLHLRLAAEGIHGPFETSWSAVKKELLEAEELEAGDLEHGDSQETGLHGPDSRDEESETDGIESLPQYFDGYEHPEEYVLEGLGVRPHMLKLQPEDLESISPILDGVSIPALP